jgi:hypothetical protein
VERKMNLRNGTKEIKRREEAGGGGDSGRGGWFGWGGRFGWSNGDNFWPEAQQTSLAVLGIIAMVRFSLFNSCVFAMSLCVINCSPPFSQDVILHVQYLVVAKGDLILAVMFNPLLYALRGTRNGLTLISSKILRNASVDGPSDFSSALKNGVYVEVSAKESVKRKWGSD